MATRNDISFFCNFCGQKISIHESRAGTTVECPGCRSYIPVPSREELDLGPAPAKPPVSNNTKKITVRIKSPLEGAPPRAPAPAAAPPTSSPKGDIPPRNIRWLVIPVFAGLVIIIGTLIIIHRPPQTPSPATVARLPVIDNKTQSIPSPTAPEERVESKTPAAADSANTGLVIHVERNNLLANGSLSGSGLAPNGWSSWNNDNHDTDSSTYRSAGNSWIFWWDGGIYQDATSVFGGDGPLAFGGYLYTPSTDALRNGTKYGVILLEFYNGDMLISTHSALPTVSSKSQKDAWIFSQGTAAVPANATKARVVVKCNDWTSGDGVFRVDDVFLGKN
jgi:hypothetical protein